MYVLCNFLFKKILSEINFSKFQNIKIYTLYKSINKLFYNTNILFKSIIELLYDIQSAYLSKSIRVNQNVLP